MKKQKSKSDTAKQNTTESASSAERSFWSSGYASAAGLCLLILLGFLIYSNSFECSFHFDDKQNIYDNELIRDLNNYKQIWINGDRPIARLTFAISYYFNQYEVRYWHYFNLAVHLLSACLVWWLSWLIMATPVMNNHVLSRFRREIAFFTALIFVAHPMATQSITYVVQRMASLAAMFYLMSVAFYIKGRMKGSWRGYLYYPLAVLSGILAVWSKENAYSLPVSIALVEICFLQERKFSLDLKDSRIWLFFGACVSILITVLLKYSLTIFKPIYPQHGQTFIVTPWNYLLTQFSVILKYVQLLLLPLSQNLDYDYPISDSFFEARTFLSFIGLAGLAGLGIWFFDRYRIFSFSIFWFFITLSVESSILPIDDLIFEHRTYLPSFGFFLGLTAVLFGLAGKRHMNLVLVLLILITGIFSVLTYNRNKVWKDEITLWSDTAKKSPGKGRPFYCLGVAYSKAGQKERALTEFTRAIKNSPQYSHAYNNRAITYCEMKEYEKAVEDCNKAIALDPNYAVTYNYRGVAYHGLKQYEKAIEDFKQAITLKPNFAEPFSNRGLAFMELGKPDRAIRNYTKAIELNPKFGTAYMNRGIAYGALQQWDKAIEDISNAIGIDPGNPQFYFRRGIAQFSLGVTDSAISDFDRAIEIDPKFAPAYTNRGVANSKIGRWDKAYEDFSKALEIDPNNAVARANQAVASNNLNKK